MNLRDLKRMLKKYGIEVEELEGVKRVTISAEGYDVVVENPQVAVLDLGQQKLIQIVCSGFEKIERPYGESPGISEEDVLFVMEQTGAAREEALRALVEEKGDIARAVLRLQEARRSGT